VTKITVTMSGFKGLSMMFSSKAFKARSAKLMRRATGRNALLAQGAIRRAIKSNINPKNAALTSAIKGSTKTLVDHGELFQAVAIKMISDTEAFAGILRTDGAFNLGVALHEGATISVTPRMRAMFFLLWLASTGAITGLDGRAGELFARYQDWKPLKKTTTVITIPARRFVEKAFSSKGLKKKMVTNWKRAVETSLKQAAKSK